MEQLPQMRENVADVKKVIKEYYLEFAARTYITAFSSGIGLRVLSHEVAEKTEREFHETGKVDIYIYIYIFFFFNSINLFCHFVL